MSWEKPIYLILFIVILGVVYLLWDFHQWRKKAMHSFADAHLIPKLFSHNTKSPYFVIKSIFLTLALVFLTLSLMGPLWGKEEQKIKREGIDIVFAVDLSNSMNAEDVAPSRLEKTKKFIESYLQQLGGDRVGLVIFAGEAYIASPLTSDYSAILSYVGALQVELITNQGTNFSSALKKSAQALGKNPQTSKAIILISDGEDHEEGLAEAIAETIKNKINIYTLGVGETSPVPVPVYDRYGEVEYKKDEKGEIVLSSFHGEVLKQIAQEAKGTYLKIESVESAVSVLKSEINKLQKNTTAEVLDVNKKKQFQWFLGIAILFFFIYNLTPDKRINT